MNTELFAHLCPDPSDPGPTEPQTQDPCITARFRCGATAVLAYSRSYKNIKYYFATGGGKAFVREDPARWVRGGGCRDHARAICRVDLVTNKTKQKQDLGPVRADYVGFV